MSPMNHTRQLLRSMDKYPHTTAHLDESVISLLKTDLPIAQKFMMPDGGKVLDHAHVKPLMTDVETIRLPYYWTVIEYMEHFDESPFERGVRTPYAEKQLIYAYDCNDRVLMTTAHSSNSWPLSDLWFVSGFGVFSKAEIADIANDKTSDGHIVLSDDVMRYEKNPIGLDVSEYKNWLADRLWNATGIVLNLIGALSCTNVSAPVTHTPAKSNPKAAYPFHSYRELMLGNRLASVGGGQGGGSSRSPREHLRRGHIRKLSNGKRTWVNATVVNAGVGGGVDKTYRMRGEA